jgi:hypothetical protein
MKPHPTAVYPEMKSGERGQYRFATCRKRHRIPKPMNLTKTDNEYYELADNDVHWQVMRASAKLEGFELKARDDLLAGQCAAGDITLDEWIDVIVKDAQGLRA